MFTLFLSFKNSLSQSSLFLTQQNFLFRTITKFQLGKFSFSIFSCIIQSLFLVFVHDR